MKGRKDVKESGALTDLMDWATRDARMEKISDFDRYT